MERELEVMKKMAGTDQGVVVLLADKITRCRFPIFIDPVTASGILAMFSEEQLIRPSTHDLFKEYLKKFNGVVKKTKIVALTDGTYIGSISFEKDGGLIELDCRPSDGIAMALRFNAPIVIEENLLNQILVDETTAQVMSQLSEFVEASDEESGTGEPK